MKEELSFLQAVKIGKFTGYHLKMIALITMVIDHVAAVVLWRLYKASFDIRGGMYTSSAISDQMIVWVSKHQELVYTIYEYMRIIGRMAFPIYCFLIVEGFLHTRNVGKYALRLLLFAFLSEIPFDLAIAETWLSFDYSNVFFTLCLGLLLLWGISFVEKFFLGDKEVAQNADKFKEKSMIKKVLCVVIVILWIIAVGALAENILHTDYGMAGILAILVIYLFRQSKELGFIASVFVLTFMSSSIEIMALLMLYPLMRYDGSRGKNVKYVFYAFYPLHLLVLALICMALGV